MSYITAIENQNRVIRSRGVSTATQADATEIYATLNDWPVRATLDRVRVTANQSFSDLTISALTDGAGYRAAVGADKSPFIIDQINDSSDDSTRSVVDFGGIYIENQFDTKHLHLMISAAAIAEGTVFTIVAEGHEELPRTRIDGPHSGTGFDRTFCVLRAPAASDAIDMTAEAMRNKNPYGLFAGFVAFADATDYLYVGKARSWSTLSLQLKGDGLPEGVTLTA